MRPSGRGLAQAALLPLCAALLAPAPAGADAIACPTQGVSVIHPEAAAGASLCAAVAEAVAFMTGHGFELKTPFRIQAVDRITQSHLATTLGTFNAKSREIDILIYGAAVAFLPDRPPFGIPMNPELYRSFVVHEVAHAVAHPNFKARPTLGAMEYIAYTVQIATMPEPLRRRVLESVQTEAFDKPGEIGDQLLMFDPARFAVKSYLHYIRPENGAAFYRRLLSGDY